MCLGYVSVFLQLCQDLGVCGVFIYVTSAHEKAQCVCEMRGCETASCLSVLGAGRHREGQTCVSMAMSGCSPFPMCWDRGMNEISFTHTQKHKHK